MDFELSVAGILDLMQQNALLGAILFGLLAFGESLVGIGVLIPGTAVMLAAGPLVGVGVLPFWDIYVAGVIGGFVGDSVSYFMGRGAGPTVRNWRMLEPHQALIDRAEAIFERWGALAVFFGRFVGPMRATVPFAAGMLAMPVFRFHFVNLASALAWVPVLVAPGWIASFAAGLFYAGRLVEAAALIALILVAGVAVYFGVRWGRARLPGLVEPTELPASNGASPATKANRDEP